MAYADACLTGALISKTANLIVVSKVVTSNVLKVGIKTHSASLEDITAVQSQFSMSVIGVDSDKL